MALSPTAARALEQVKMGLYMLRGADYFTEEEWIKIDGLIHKGRYVFTNGPQTNTFDEELINFDDNNEKDESTVQIPTKAFDPIKEEIVQVSEREIPSPTMSDPAECSDFPAETPNTTSAEVSSDDEHSVPTTADNTSEKESQPTEPTPTPRRESVQLPKNGGLALGYTQAQLDEVKAFNSGLTKAGQKSKPGKGNRRMSESNGSQNQPLYDAAEPASYSSGTLTDQDTHKQIQTWASDVHAQDNATTPTPDIKSPAPTKGWTPTPPPDAKPLIEAFKMTHGRNPKSVNDLVQPNNPGFRPLTARPFSRISQKSTKSSGTSITPTTPVRGVGLPKLNVKPGTILIAQRSCVAKSKIQIDVNSGDQIKYLKHVSATTHVGENMRTSLKGQFNEDIFKKSLDKPNALIQQQRAAVAKQGSGSLGVIGDGRYGKVNTASNGLERIEGINAAEWDDVASVTTSKTTNSIVVKARAIPSVAQTSIVKPAGLGSSRFADEDEKSGNDANAFQGVSKEELGQLIDQKFAQILAAQASRASPTIPTAPSRPPFNPRHKASIVDPLKKVNPKTATCWWWATPNKECRFTAEECRDLHAYLPSTGVDPPNLRMGKPTWGALADSVPPTTTTTTSQIQSSVFGIEVSDESLLGPQGQANVGVYKSKTCWYWANDAKGCSNSATDCKYLHEKCIGGVANKPNSWKKFEWNRFGISGEKGSEGEGSGGHAWTINGDAETDAGVDDGELVLEEVRAASNGWAAETNASYSGWGEESDRYKPPHIKALEDKALIEAVGW